MHASILFASLIASVAYATPFGARDSWTTVTAPVASGSPTFNPTALLGNPTASANPIAETGFVSTLRSANSTVGRFQELKAEINKGLASLKFDFNPAANPDIKLNMGAGLGGEVVVANRVKYPLVTDTGISGAALFFAPCGLNTPHIHPRASEFLTVATDSNIRAGFVLENGFTAEQNTTLTQFQGMVFPQGSIHWQQNMDCKPAVALAALNSDDAGASSLAQNFLKFTSSDVVDAALGFPAQIDADNFAAFKDKIPAPFAQGMKECFARCNMKY